MSTPHINGEKGDFAQDVIMPGDPKRAELIARDYLSNARLVSDIRGILAFTGDYQGHPISVMASGMGIPSISIYATELARFFGVKRIIRVGTCGGLQPDVRIKDVIIASTAHTDSAISVQSIAGVNLSHGASPDLLISSIEAANTVMETSSARAHVGAIMTSDLFYSGDSSRIKNLTLRGTLAVEMEAAGLYSVAAVEGIQALTLATVSDHLLTREELTAEERQTDFQEVMKIALATLRSTTNNRKERI